MNSDKLTEFLRGGGADARLAEIYGAGRVGYARERLIDAIAKFTELYGGGRSLTLLSVPGRSEIVGNHTDHNRGKVLAAAVNYDIIAVAAQNYIGTVNITSCGYSEDRIPAGKRPPVPSQSGHAASLIAGVCAGFVNRGYTVGGLDAYTVSDVKSGSGMSSSAAFEVMVGNIMSCLYNDGRVSPTELAQIGQYAENEYFGKPCGLMDQLTCATGGFIKIDFADPAAPEITRIPYDLGANGYELCIIDSNSGHQELGGEYASIPREMKAVAAMLGAEVLRDTDKAALLSHISAIRRECGDRAVLRALHYFNENECVDRVAAALEAGDISAFLRGMNDSGTSSCKYLQNIYVGGEPDEQPLSVTLGICEELLRGIPHGCRVHGGGFAGTVLVVLPAGEAARFRREADAVLGEGSCHIPGVRNAGAVKIL